MGNIIIDTDREFFFRISFSQFIKDSLDLVRSRILGSDTVSAADQFDIRVFQNT